MNHLESLKRFLGIGPQPSIHVGFLGDWRADPDYFAVVLSPEEDQQLKAWYNEHQSDDGIYCKMDAVGHLFRNRLKLLTPEEVHELACAGDPRIPTSRREFNRLIEKYSN